MSLEKPAFSTLMLIALMGVQLCSLLGLCIAVIIALLSTRSSLSLDIPSRSSPTQLLQRQAPVCQCRQLWIMRDQDEGLASRSL